MSVKCGLSAALMALACFVFTQAQDDTGSGLPEGLKIRPHAYGYLQAGQIENGSLRSYTIADIKGNNLSDFKIDHVWTEDALMYGGFEAIYRDHFKMELTLGADLYFSYPQESDQRYTKNSRQDVFIDKVYSQYSIGDLKAPLLLGQAGYFYYKYNPDGCNFGDYLFRTGTYPIYFNMAFDFPVARLLGFHLQSNPLPGLKLDGILASALIYPAMDWSLAGLASYDVANLHFLEFGAGIDLADLFDVYTTHSFPVKFGGDPTEPHGNFNDQYIKSINGADTTYGYYTFKGTKVMGRVSIDPKIFLPSNLWGKNDLKLYAEADIIGLENYPDSGYANGHASGSPYDLIAPSYNKWWEKMPIMVGFNLPTFKVLDILNAEVEWFGAKYYNDPSGLINYGNMPLPYQVQNTTGDVLPIKSQFKWSVYAKKSFLHGLFAVTGQVGRDHLTLQTADYNKEMYSELLIEPSDWWWVLKTSWSF